MGQLVLGNLDDGVQQRLRRRAEEHGRSVEEEARQILSDAVPVGLVEEDTEGSVGLGTRLARIFSQLDFDPEIKELRGELPRPATFDP